MDSAIALEVGKEAIYTLLSVSLPLMLIALVVGLTVSLFQALTQIQEMTLSFVPKIIAIFFSLILFMPFIGGKLAALVENHLAALIISGAG